MRTRRCEMEVALSRLAPHILRALDHDHIRLPALLGESRIIHVEDPIQACIALYEVLHVLVKKNYRRQSKITSFRARLMTWLSRSDISG